MHDSLMLPEMKCSTVQGGVLTCCDGLLLIQVQVKPDGQRIEGACSCDLQLDQVVPLLALAHALEEVLECLCRPGQHLVWHVVQVAGLVPLVPPAPNHCKFQTTLKLKWCA